MSDNWLQVSALGSGVTAATATLTGVTAGSTLAAFCFNGSTSAPTTHSVSDGTAYSPGASAIDTGNAIFAQVFYLQNVASGTHAAIFSGDIGNGLDIYLVEIGTTAGASAVVDTKANDQVGVAGGAGANALTSGSLAIPAACTIAAMSCDTTSANAGDEPSAGTSPIAFTSRANAVTSNSGAGRVETGAAAANAAATFGVTSGSPGNYVTLAIAVLNAPAASGDVPSCYCSDQESEIFEADDARDMAPYAFYADMQVPVDVVPLVPLPELPDPELFADIEEVYPDYNPNAPPANLVLDIIWPYFPDEIAGDPVVEDDEDNGEYEFVLPFDAEPMSADSFGEWPDLPEEPEDEPHGFAEWQTPLDAVVSTDQPQPQFPEAEESEDESLGFELAPLDGSVDQIQAHYPDQSEEAEDESFGFVDWQLPPDNETSFDLFGSLPSQADEPEDEDFSFLDSQVPPDFIPDQVPDSLLCFPAEAEEPEDEDFAFTLAPIAADNDISADTQCVFPAEAEEPEDEPFGAVEFQLPADQVIEEPPEAVRPVYPAEVEEPEDEDFGGFDMQVPEDFVPPPTPVFVPAGKHRKKKFRNELGDFDSRAEADAALGSSKPQPKPAPRIKPATTAVEPVRTVPAPVQLPRISPVMQAVQQALSDVRRPLPRDTRDDEAIAKAIVSAMRADQEAIKGLRGALITLASLRRRR